MNTPLDLKQLEKLEGQLKNQIEQDKKYWRVNEVKCDAIYTSKTYEEFRCPIPKFEDSGGEQRLLEENATGGQGSIWAVAPLGRDREALSFLARVASDRVAAAHLIPLEKRDHIKAGSCKTVWNTAAKDKEE